MKHEFLGTRTRRSLRLLTSAAIVALTPAFVAVDAFAQEAAPTQTAQTTQSIETIEVTGTRIANTDAASANPITVVGAATIAQEKSTNVEEILRKTPSIDFTGTFSGNDNNGGLGSSGVSMRNLGPQRTLVLVNGERFPYTDLQQPSFAEVDTNNIPVSLIDHIDILRDGASSVYGADAIGGVVNIITKQHFNGVEVGGSVGETSYGDGLTYSVYSTLGSDFDNGNILINVSHDNRAYIPGSARSWYVDEHPEADFNGFSSVSSRVTGLKAYTENGKFFFYGKDGNFVPFGDPGNIALPPGDLFIPAYGGIYFNYQPTQGLIGALDRNQINLTGHYDITPDVTATLDAFYTDRRSREQLNPEPIGPGVTTPKFPGGIEIPEYLENGTDADGNPILLYGANGKPIANPANPTNPSSPLYNAAFANAAGGPQDLVIATRRFENGPRIYTDDSNTYRVHASLAGSILDDYTWEAGYIYGRSDLTYNTANETDFEHLAQLTGQVPCFSASVCSSVTNLFGYQTLTPAQAQYIAFTNTDTSSIELSEAYGNISGPVFDGPAGQIKSVIGFEYRTDSLSDQPDSIVQSGDAAVFQKATSGDYETASGYVEVNAPLLKDLPLVKLLTADASGRYDYNTTFGRALTWKAGLDYAIDDDFRLRGSRSTGFRAPQLRELYSGGSLGAFSTPGGAVDDVCSAGAPYANTPACLIASGGNPNSLSGNPGQISGLQEGAKQAGLSLRPEESQQWSVGGVYTPTYVPGFSLTADYYTILVRNEIGSLDPYNVISACYGGIRYLISQQQACSQVVRAGRNAAGQATGLLSYVNVPVGNIGEENTSGIEVAADYVFPTESVGLGDWGHFAIDGQASYLLSDNTSAGGLTLQNAGTISGASAGGAGEPRWKATLGATVTSNDGWSFNWTTRYYGGLKPSPGGDCEASDGVADCNDYEGSQVAGVFYHDIAVTYVYNNIHVTVGVDNLLDKDPPFLEFGGGPYATDAGYDATGRFVFMKASVNFGAAGTPSPAAPAPVPPPPAAVQPAPAPMPEKQREFQVFFDFDKSNITEAAARVIQAAADVVKSGGIAHITVTGHTDTVGTAKYNQGLSERRAASVKSALVTDGVDGGEVTTVGVGKTGLLVPTKDGVREPQNRRAVIELQ